MHERVRRKVLDASVLSKDRRAQRLPCRSVGPDLGIGEHWKRDVVSDITDQYARKSPLGEERYREMVAAMRRQPKPATPPPIPAAEDIANTVEDLRRGRAASIDRGPRAEKTFKLAGELAGL